MSGFDYAQQERRIASLESNRGASLRFGTVTGVDTATGTARVQLPDGDGMVTMPLRVLGRRTLKDKAQALPDIGEPVACLFSGQGLEQGVILGAHYTAKTPSPNQEAQVDYVRYEDGTELWYDRKGHKLTAKVKGTVEIEAKGSVRVSSEHEVVAESETGITLKAPRINLAGKLSVTDRDGRSGSGDLFGNYRILEGDMCVPGGDVIAGVTSLRKHIHNGVESGPSTSDSPTDGTQNGDSGLDEDAERERIFGLVTGVKNRLVRCMPEMVAAEAERTLEQGNMTDHQGWLYLHEGILKWLYGKGKAMPDDKLHNGWQEPLWVEWNWLMQYERFRKAVEELKQPNYLFSEKARANLTRLLREESAFIGEGQQFDHIHLPWWEWRRHAIQGKKVGIGIGSLEELKNSTEVLDGEALAHGQIKPDGFQASIANTTIYALTSGRTEQLESGEWIVFIEKVAFFIHDAFDFNGDQWLGNWICDEPYRDDATGETVEGMQGFNIFAFPLTNANFRHFRDETGYGRDFRTLCIPELVLAKEFFYDAS